MDVPTKLALFDCKSGHDSIARIETLTREAAKIGVAPWWNGLENLVGIPDDQPDSEWDWVYLISVTIQNKPLRRAVCVRTGDGMIQGAMLYRLDAKSLFEPGKGAVFVDRIATAPHNREGLVGTPKYRGVGDGLLAYAVAESVYYGHECRVNLFPIANLEFYTQRGFRPTPEVTGDGDILYELPATEGKAILKKRGVL